MFQDNIQITLPDGFLNAEERCGHLVTSEMKKVWAVELDLLYVFQQFCSEHNLKWFMAYGSLIGAVRHKGFIPWDNDIDVMMPRDDFDKFCELAPKYFKRPYFFQSPISEHGKYYQPFAKLRNSETTAASKGEFLKGINCGIFIDIFVLDSVPDTTKILNHGIRKINYLTHYSRFLSPYPREFTGLRRIINYFWKITWRINTLAKNGNGEFLFEKVNNCCRKMNSKKGDRCSFYAGGYKPKEVWQKEWWTEPLLLAFEFMTVPVPKGFHHILISQYGNYMNFPKVEERITHDYFDFSADTPYTSYFEQ